MSAPIPPLQISIELEGLDALEAAPQTHVMQAFEQGALRAAEYVRGLWAQVAHRMKIRHTGSYIDGIQSRGQIRVVSRNVNERSAEIVIAITNTSPHASIVEDGHPAFSLVHAIDWGRTDGRIKRTREGRPYLHIPFRHSAYVPTEQRADQGTTYSALRRMMPEDIYRQATQLRPTMKHNQGPFRAHGGQFIAADRYTWGGRLNRPHTRPAIIAGGPGVGAGGRGEPAFEEHRGQRLIGRDHMGRPLVNPAWQSSKFHGLFKTGSAGHSQYMTIRTITPDSPGWNIPAQAGYGVARRVASHLSSGHGAQRFNDIIMTGMRRAMGAE